MAPTMGKLRHDLNNQLGIIVGFSELVLADLEPSNRLHGDLEEIHTAAVRALELVAEMSREADASGE